MAMAYQHNFYPIYHILLTLPLSALAPNTEKILYPMPASRLKCLPGTWKKIPRNLKNDLSQISTCHFSVDFDTLGHIFIL